MTYQFQDYYDIIRRKFNICWILGMPFIEILNTKISENSWSSREYIYSIIMHNLERELDKQINEYYKTNRK